MEENKITEYKKKNFIIAVILTSVSFILNTVCVANSHGSGGEFGSVWWNTDFNLFYWIKTIVAIFGLFYFFRSGIFTTKQVPRYLSIFTLIILLYSIPIVNFIFLFIPAIILKGIIHYDFVYKDRVIIQLIWPVFVFVLLLFTDRLINGLKR
jgi:hypothetical protein